MINILSKDILTEINKYLTQSEKIALRKTCKKTSEVPLTIEMFLRDITMYEFTLWLFNKKNIINKKIEEISSYSLFKSYSGKISLSVDSGALVNFKICSKYIKVKDHGRYGKKYGKFDTAEKLYKVLVNFQLCYQYEYRENWLLFQDILNYRIIKQSQLNVEEIFLNFIKMHCVQLRGHLSSYEICNLYQCVNVLNDETIDKLEKEFIEAFKIPARLNLTQKPFCSDKFILEINLFLKRKDPHLDLFALEYHGNHNPLNLDIIEVNDWLKKWFLTLTLSNIRLQK